MLIPFRISVSLLVRYIYICLLDPDSSYDISVVKIHWHFALSEALNRYVYVTTFGANCCRLYLYHNVIKRNQGHLVVISVSGLTVINVHYMHSSLTYSYSLCQLLPSTHHMSAREFVWQFRSLKIISLLVLRKVGRLMFHGKL